MFGSSVRAFWSAFLSPSLARRILNSNRPMLYPLLMSGWSIAVSVIVLGVLVFAIVFPAPSGALWQVSLSVIPVVSLLLLVTQFVFDETPAQTFWASAILLMITPAIGIAPLIPAATEEIVLFATGLAIGMVGTTYYSPSIRTVQALAVTAFVLALSLLFAIFISANVLSPLAGIPIVMCGCLAGFLRVPFWLLSCLLPQFIDEAGVLPIPNLPQKLKRRMEKMSTRQVVEMLQDIARNPYNRWAISHVLPSDIPAPEFLVCLLSYPIRYFAPTVLADSKDLKNEEDGLFLVKKVLAELSGKRDTEDTSERIAFAITQRLRKPIPTHLAQLSEAVYGLVCNLHYADLPEEERVSIARKVVSTALAQR